MPLIPDGAALQNNLATLPVRTYQAGETVLNTGSRTEQLMILKKGTVAIVRNGVEIARVSDPGAVFGEASFLLDQPYAADVRALESTEFNVADAAMLLHYPFAFKDIASILCKRVDIANQILIDLSAHLNSLVGVSNWEHQQEKLLDNTDASLVYAGYPFDPYAMHHFLAHQINAACLLLSAR